MPGLGLKGASTSLYEELESRGYDITTFKFSIKKKTAAQQPTDKSKKEG